MNWWALFLGFSGRINRAKYWLCVLASCVSIFVALFLSIDVLENDYAAILALVPSFWIYLAATVKRLHDLDRSGWWLIPWLFIPAGQVILGILPGTPGMNRYGSDPLTTLQTA
jgi:uncharacterized membrane protein YhaH (DUF805 family)